MYRFSLRLMAALIAITVFVVNGAKAQAPQAVPYQAVVRNAAGNAIANKTVALRFSIRDAAATGTVVYQERQSAITNALGLFSVNVGQGTVATGTFSGIDWAGNTKFLQIEVDTTGGTTYISMGTQQLLSVPYALNAKKADSATYATNAANGVPAGTIEAFGGPIANIPSGWLLCDGTPYNQSTYPKLYAAIGISWGTGGTNMFRVPDLRGFFLRGVNGANNMDPDANARTSGFGDGGQSGNNVGSYQASAFASHNHSINDPGHIHYLAHGDNVLQNATAHPQDFWPSQSSTVNYGTNSHNQTTTSYTGITGTNYTGNSETRPVNAYVNYIIKL